jgi:hypothetical protein
MEVSTLSSGMFLIYANGIRKILSTVHAAYSLLAKTTTSNSQCWKPYAVKAQSTLLTMGIKMPETCWDITDSINHYLLHLVGLVLIYLRKIPFIMEIWQIHTTTDLSSIIRPNYHYGAAWWPAVFSLLNQTQMSQRVWMKSNTNISWDKSVFSFSYSPKKIKHIGDGFDVY